MYGDNGELNDIDAANKFWQGFISNCEQEKNKKYDRKLDRKRQVYSLAIKEDEENNMVFFFEMAGVIPTGAEIVCEDGILKISGGFVCEVTKHETETERTLFKYESIFDISSYKLNTNTATATMKDGILKVTFEKKEENKRKVTKVT